MVRFITVFLLLCLASPALAGEICLFDGPLLGVKSKSEPNKCGPNSIMRWSDRLGFKTTVDMWKFVWIDTKNGKKKSKTFDVAEEVCKPHDQCYEDIKDGRKSCTQQSFDECNDAVKTRLDQLCKKLPKGCARKRCRNVMRDAMYGIVKAFEKNYKNKYC